jgi:23S rRNA pseudouridine1911/1915/1917 synthase
MTQFIKDILVDEIEDNVRVDVFVANVLPDFSRNRIKTWIKQGKLRVNGISSDPDLRLHPGDIITINASLEHSSSNIKAQEISLNIVAKDDDFIVINKPVGLVVHPGAGNPDGTLQNALLALDKHLINLPRSGIVHRIDKNTSGLMVIARNIKSYQYFIEQISNRHVTRVYNAIVTGVPISGGQIDKAIGRHARDRTKMQVRQDGKEAITNFIVLNKYKFHSLLELRLETGRTHQIRVHLNSLGYPIMGDRVYGGKPKFPKGVSEKLRLMIETFNRQALHAKKLAFKHPRKDEIVSFEIDLPQDMKNLIELITDEDNYIA